MIRFFRYLAGFIFTAVLLAMLGYILTPTVFSLMHNNRVIDHTQIIRVQGVAFNSNISHIEQAIDTRLLYIAKPFYKDKELCLRLWLGTDKLLNPLQIVDVNIKSDQRIWSAVTALNHQRTWLFCFKGLRLQDIQTAVNSSFEISVKNPDMIHLLGGIHGGFSKKTLKPAKVNGDHVEQSLQYVLEVNAGPTPLDLFRYLMVLLFSSAILYSVILGPLLHKFIWRKD